MHLPRVLSSKEAEEAKVARLIESMRNGTFTLDQYLFGTSGCLRLTLLSHALRSDLTSQPLPMYSILTKHPERPLSLDELLKVCINANGDMKGSTQHKSVASLRAELSLLPPQHADRSSCLLRLADALSRRFWKWAQSDDLEEAIWSYEEALSLISDSHYQYLETLLGLCSSVYQRFYLLRLADDLKSLLRYLELQRDVLNRRRSLLAPIETQLTKLCRVLSPEEERLGIVQRLRDATGRRSRRGRVI